MLAPDLIKVKPPKANIQYSETKTDSPQLERDIRQHYFNHSVIAAFPDTLHVPDELKQTLLSDSQYYLIENCPLYFLVEPTFIEGFVKKGELTIQSVNQLIDVDICCCVTPRGELVISVNRDTFLKLGIERGPAVHITKLTNRSRYLLVIKLKEPCFNVDKNNYKRVLNQMFLSQLSATIIATWEPSDVRVCPSSLASYFQKKGLRCEECSLSYVEKRIYNVSLPTYNNRGDELFEWLGIFLLGATQSKEEEEVEEYLSSYSSPEDTEEIGQMLVMQATGLITSTKIYNLLKTIRNYLPHRSSIPWVGMHIQGFDDSIITWNLTPHTYSVFGDNNYSVICHRNGLSKTFKLFTSLKNRDL